MSEEQRRPVHGGLRLPDTASLSGNEFDEVLARWKMAEEWARNECRQLLDAVTPSDGRPGKLSGKELMTISPNEYAEAYTRRLGWMTTVAKIRTSNKVRLCRLEGAANELSLKIKHTNRSLATKAPSAEELKERVGLQPHYAEITLEIFKYDALKQLLDQEYDEALENLKALSRQVEIRKEEFGGERRDGNVPKAVAKYRRD